jgi:hypothetical protein
MAWIGEVDHVGHCIKFQLVGSIAALRIFYKYKGKEVGLIYLRPERQPWAKNIPEAMDGELRMLMQVIQG